MSGKASRDKGNRLERLVVGIFDAAGIPANRVPLSGAVDGYKGDIRLILNGKVLIGEAKSRAGAFGSFYRWLQGNDFLAIKQDRGEPLIVIEARKLALMLATIPHNPITEAASKPPGQPLEETAPQIEQPTSIPFDIEPMTVKLQSGGKPSIRC